MTDAAANIVTSEGAKCCGKCRRMLPPSSFNRNRTTPDGRSWDCSECQRARGRVTYARRRERDPGDQARRSRKWASDNPARRLVHMAKRRARSKGVPFDLPAAGVTIPPACPALGVPMEQGGGFSGRWNSPSLDRIVPELGYTEDNVVVVSWLANVIRNTATPDQIIRVGEFYRDLLQHRSALRRPDDNPDS